MHGGSKMWYGHHGHLTWTNTKAQSVKQELIIGSPTRTCLSIHVRVILSYSKRLLGIPCLSHSVERRVDFHPPRYPTILQQNVNAVRQTFRGTSKALLCYPEQQRARQRLPSRRLGRFVNVRSEPHLTARAWSGSLSYVLYSKNVAVLKTLRSKKACDLDCVFTLCPIHCHIVIFVYIVCHLDDAFPMHDRSIYS